MEPAKCRIHKHHGRLGIDTSVPAQNEEGRELTSKAFEDAILITVEGGRVTCVSTKGRPKPVVLIDYDVEGSDLDDPWILTSGHTNAAVGAFETTPRHDLAPMARDFLKQKVAQLQEENQE